MATPTTEELRGYLAYTMAQVRHADYVPDKELCLATIAAIRRRVELHERLVAALRNMVAMVLDYDAEGPSSFDEARRYDALLAEADAEGE